MRTIKQLGNYIAIWTIIIIGFPLLCTAEEKAFPRGVKWEQIKTEHFVILFVKQHERAAQRVAHLAEAVHADLVQFLDIDQEKEFKKRYVIITDQSDVVDQYDPALPEHELVIDLRRPHAGNSPALSAYSQDWLAQQFIYQYTITIRHEIDGLFRKILGVPFPDAGFSGWMERGMAAYMEHILYEEQGRSSYFDMILRTEMLEDRLTTLEQRAAIGVREWPGDIGVFAYGYGFLEYLAETYSVDQLAVLNQTQSGTIPLFGDDAFETVYGESLDRLQKEWRAAIQRRYAAQLQEIQSQPLTPSTPLSDSGDFTHSPVFSPDGQSVYYIAETRDETPQLIRLRLSDQTQEAVTAGYFSGDFSLSPDGSMLCFCKTAVYKGYYEVSDLYLLDLETRNITRLTKGEHAFDPVFTPDSEAVIYTTSDVDTTTLMRLELDNGQRSALLTTNNYSQIRHPAVSPDGATLAVQLWRQGGFEDMYLLNSDGTGLRAITQDKAMDRSPAWSSDGNTLFFSSDRTGVPNIFAYSLSHQTLSQVTNVLTGAFDPAVSPDGTRLAFDVYSGAGMNIHVTERLGEHRGEVIVMAAEQPATSEKYAGTAQHDIRRYHPLSSLIPRPGPAFTEDAEGYMLGLTLSGKDILEQHEYSLAVLYGLKSEDIAYEVEYINKQFFPTIRLFGEDMPEKYHNLFRNTAGEEEAYFERRQGFGLDIAVPVVRTHLTTVSVLAGYDYQMLSNLTDLAELSEPLPDKGTLSSTSTGLLVDRLGDSSYPDERSGQLVLLKYSRYDESLGSDFTIDEFTGELDVRLKVPFLRNHLLQLRTAGGLSEGETLEQGMFQLGGFLVNSPAHILEGPQFYLRGYEENAFAGDRVVVGTAEYRFPIWYPQRTIWGGRIFIDSITGGVFYETGDAWKDDERDLDLKQSVGGELTLNFGAYYGKYPVSLGVGFAQGLDDDLGESQVYFKFGMGM